MNAVEERKLVTILFADIVGSTTLTAADDPERVRLLMDQFFDAMQQEVAASGGTVEKFAGDAVLASFGAAAAQEDHAERALHTALAMARRVEELFGDRLAVRIGVNTGDVVVGPARAGGTFLTGDAVNVAARIEQGAAAGQILVGERTIAAVRGAFEFEDPETIEAKGKPDGVTCARLVRAVTLMRPRGVPGRAAVFVGRQAELDELKEAYRQVVAAGRPHLVTIAGEPGVGKSRLVRELWGWLADQSPRPFCRTGRCLAYGQFTYWPLGEAVKEHLGILETDSPEAVRERLRGREMLGLALGVDVAPDLHPLAARNQLHEAWVGFLEELAAERPTVVLIEDVHWAEESLLDLLARTARDVRGPLLLVTTTRPELLAERASWGAGRQGSSVVLVEALDEGASALLADELGGERLTSDLREAIVARAEGNPFFVEELIAALGESGGEPRLPDSVKAVLAARIDLLPRMEKSALQAASVIGRIFWAEPVRTLLGDGEPDWWLLEDREFVRRRSTSSIPGEAEYAIKHALTREVAYETLPRSQRARFHAAFADWLERIGDGRDEHAGLLAHHYAEAARPEDADLAWSGAEEELQSVRRAALRWLRRAAELAIGRYEIDEGIAFLERAVSLDPDEVERTAIWREIGRANALKYDGRAFWEAMEESLKTCSDRATCGETYSLLAFHSVIRAGMWIRLPEPGLVDGWIDSALELSEPGSEAYVRTLVARAYWRGESEEAAAREASAMAERLGDVELRSYALMARCATAYSGGRYKEAFDWTQRRFDLLPELTDPDHVTDLLENAVPAILAVGHFREARRLSWEHIELSKRLTSHHRMHGVSLLAETEELAGRWEAVRALRPDVELAAQENRETPCIRNPRSLLLCAAASALAGDVEGAAALESAAGEFDFESPRLTAPLIRLAMARGAFGELERLVEEDKGVTFTWTVAFRAARLDALAALRARDQVEEEANPVPSARSYLEPFALRALGIVRGDDALIEQAQAAFAALRLDWHAAQTERLVQQA